MFDHGPAAAQMARLVDGVRDDQLGAPTPCPSWSLADLIEHIHQLTCVFTGNAGKRPLPDVRLAVDGRLPDDWREVLHDRLDALVEAWTDPDAWTGRVSAGGVDMTGEQNAVVAVEELVVHGWDVARASGQDFHVDEASLTWTEAFLAEFALMIASGEGPYGPPVAVPDDATRLDRLLGATGRDPGWSASR